MTAETFNQIVESTIVSCKDLLGVKGSDYTDGKDRLSNFKEVGKRAGVTPKQIWLVYFSKHIAAIEKFCSAGKVESEPIGGRIDDAINYLYLLKGLIAEEIPAPYPVVVCTMTQSEETGEWEVPIPLTSDGRKMKKDGGGFWVDP